MKPTAKSTGLFCSRLLTYLILKKERRGSGVNLNFSLCVRYVDLPGLCGVSDKLKSLGKWRPRNER